MSQVITTTLSPELKRKRSAVKHLSTLLMLLAACAIVFSFVPNLNPVRISSEIWLASTQKNTYTDWSLFETAGSTLWRLLGVNHTNQEKNLSDAGQYLLFAFSNLLLIGVWTVAVSAFVSRKFVKKRTGAAKAALIGAGLQFAGLGGILAVYFSVKAEGTLPPLFPKGLPVYALLACGCLLLSLICLRLKEPADLRELVPVPHRKLKVIMQREAELWIIAILAIGFVLVFTIIPLFGNVISLINFKVKKGGFLLSIFKSDWRGLWQFRRFFGMADSWKAIRNTLVMGTLNITVGFVAPIILALLMNEIQNTFFKRFTQTVSYLPHFVSWVVVASIAMTILGNDNGIINNALRQTGIIGRDEYIAFLDTGKWYWYLIEALNIWKGIGWGTIIYISAITGIDQELYEAGACDGLGRFGMAWHITLPGIRTTVMMLFILGTAGIISGGFEQHLLLGNLHTIDYYETIDTFVYRYFSGSDVSQDYSLSNAVGLLTSGIGIVLMLITNGIMRKATDMSLF